PGRPREGPGGGQRPGDRAGCRGGDQGPQPGRRLLGRGRRWARDRGRHECARLRLAAAAGRHAQPAGRGADRHGAGAATPAVRRLAPEEAALWQRVIASVTPLAARPMKAVEVAGQPEPAGPEAAPAKPEGRGPPPR
ncbi:hypothetical protein QU38_00845, partial [Staphylococcus aureus]